VTRKVFWDDPYRTELATQVAAVDGDEVTLEATILYAMSGGQESDAGSIADRPVLEARKVGADIVYRLAPGHGLRPGEPVTLCLDWERRYRLMRLHSALHLLGAVVKAPVTGGRIGEDKAHLDFDVDMSRLVAGDIEAQLNELVQAAVDTRVRWITDAELDAHPELVRTMSVAPPRGEGRVRLLEIAGIDLQACGGTHVANIAEIGALRVVRIRSEGKRNKRVTLELA
jgi:misacylated tRNA(Ala) deacylase